MNQLIPWGKDEMRDQLKKKAADKTAVLERRLILNDDCELKMCQMMGSEDRCENLLKNINHEIIAKCNSDELKAFITARNENLPISKLPNKGNIPSAIQGESNLISLVYEYRALPNLRKQLLDEKEDNELIDLDDIINKKKRRTDLFTILNIDNTQDESAFFSADPILPTCQFRMG